MTVERMDEGAQRVQIAERVRTRRKDLGLTQDVLAIRAEISKSFMSEVESGVTSANALVYVRLARALNCSVEFLLTGDSPPRQSRVVLELGRIAEALQGLGQQLGRFDDKLTKQLDVLIDEVRAGRGDR